MSEAEIEDFQEAMDAQGEELRKALAEDLGGDAEDYRVDDRVAANGGDS